MTRMKSVRRGVAATLLFVLPLFSQQAIAQSSTLGTMTLDDLEGPTTRLSEYLEKGPVYLSFWALWCESCKQELRALKSVVDDNKGKSFSILAINIDTPKSLAKVKAFVRSRSYPFKVILDPNKQILQKFNGQNLPFSVLLNTDGTIVSTRTGFLPGDEKEIQQEIFALLNKEGAGN